MPLSLERYAEVLEERGIPFPVGPGPIPPKAKPALRRLGVRAVVFGGFGSLLLIDGNAIQPLPEDPVMREIALEKTIQEFGMWTSMSRKPGKPSEYMATIFRQVADKLRFSSSSPVLRVEQVWEGILDRLEQKEFTYDVGTYGDREAFCQKITYFYLKSAQGIQVVPDAWKTLRDLHARGVRLGVHAEGQVSTPVQLLRGLAAQGPITSLGNLFDARLMLWSHEIGDVKTSARGWRALEEGVAAAGLDPGQVLYVGVSIDDELGPARRHGFRTALLAVHKPSIDATPEQLRDEKTKPDCLLTAFSQLSRVVEPA